MIIEGKSAPKPPQPPVLVSFTPHTLPPFVQTANLNAVTSSVLSHIADYVGSNDMTVPLPLTVL